MFRLCRLLVDCEMSLTGLQPNSCRFLFTNSSTRQAKILVEFTHGAWETKTSKPGLLVYMCVLMEIPSSIPQFPSCIFVLLPAMSSKNMCCSCNKYRRINTRGLAWGIDIILPRHLPSRRGSYGLKRAQRNEFLLCRRRPLLFINSYYYKTF